MKNIFCTLLISILLFSCVEEKLPEVINPRFSVAFIQEINEEGVTFGANIFDFGKKEILEYGFFYGQQSSDLVDIGEKISTTGQPDTFFELTATYALTKGREYHVIAFIKTAESMVVTQPQSFISQGSTGFIFERLDFSDKIYFNDTIRVYGENLSPKIESYKAKINGTESIVSAVEKEYFEIIIPDNLNPQLDNTSVFDFEIAGKNLSLELPFKLREPEFEINSERLINLSEPIVIRGKYLRSNPSEIKIANNLSSSFNISGTYTDSTIVFEPFAVFPTNKPSIIVQIRGKEYVVENNFKLLPKLFEENQVINSSFANKVKIKGENFNPYNIGLNVIQVDNDNIITNIYSVKEDEIEVIFLTEKPLTNTSFDLSILSHGEVSETKVKINMRDPRSPIMDLGSSPARKFQSIGNNLYFISNSQVHEIDIFSKIKTTKASIPYKDFPLGLAEIFVESNGKLYFSESIMTDNGNFNYFFEYNPLNNEVNSLPLIPSEALLQKWSFALGDYIYIGGGEYIQGSDNYTIDEHLYRFHVKSRIWEKLPPSTILNSTSLFSFIYSGEIYGLSGNYNDSNYTTLFKFNPNSNQWIEIKKFDALPPISQKSQSTSIGDFVFFGTNQSLYYLDMGNLLIDIYIIQGYDYQSTFHLGTSLGEHYYYPMEINGIVNLIQFNPSL
ncbi:hypothetical protein GCM10026987_27450 [Belliella aquatica]|uniref:IPT/TIG domain-containing protein n=1 Tax=Belliella aquatica TaxID=1323734 RepID=A0ABQ1N133_9BACT|nr:hypothetical protein GCM10010993_31330 [Belliella aquatica]